jgi:YjbR
VAGAGDVLPEFEDRLRALCMSLPDAYEEPAWVGVRWMVRKRTFAHAYGVESPDEGSVLRTMVRRFPVGVVTFRAPDDDIAGLLGSGFPFFHPGWGSNVVAMVLDGHTDWSEVAELITDSYRVQAPKKLARLVEDR